MLFTDDQRQRIASGEITMAFRCWKRPQARAGREQRLDASGAIAVEDVAVVPVSSITGAESRRCGHTSRQSLVDELRARGSLEPDDLVYRIAFRYEAQPDPRSVLANDEPLDEAALRDLRVRLERMDERTPHGPWTRQTLELIETHPRVLSTTLAGMCGRERLAFKADVRKLKALGLTISHEIGYELSARGGACLAAMRSSVTRGTVR